MRPDNPAEPERRFCPKCGHGTTADDLSTTPIRTRPAGITFLATTHFLAAIFLLLGALAALSSERGSERLLLMLVVFGGLAALSIYTGQGLWTLRRRGWILQLVLAWLGLLAFPVGTVISVMVLCYLYLPGIRILFSGIPPEQLTTEEIEKVSRIRTRTTATGVAIVVPALLFFMALYAAIAIPGLLNAIDRGKQKRTMKDIRALGTAVEAYFEDEGVYPVADDIDGLREFVEPTYIRVAPRQDGWDHPLHVRSRESGYFLLSSGSDGRPDPKAARGATSRFESDIIFENGEFVQWPESTRP